MVSDRTRQPAAPAGQRQDGQLHHFKPIDHEVEDTDLIRMDHVFRIVQHDRLVSETTAPFLGQHRPPDDVQAIRLGRRAEMRIDAQHQARIVLCHRGDGVDGRTVVGIDTHKDAIVGLAPLCQRVTQHRADHFRLAPCGHENGDPSGPGRGWQGRGRHAGMASIDGQVAPTLATQEQQVDDEVVQPANRQSNHREQ